MGNSAMDFRICEILFNTIRGRNIGSIYQWMCCMFLCALIIVLSTDPLYGQDSDDALFIDEKGNVGIGTNHPGAKLDVKGDINSAGTVNAEKFEGDGSALAVEGSGILKEALDKKFDKAGGKVEGSLDVNGLVRARTFASTNPLRHRMYPNDPVVYQDIFEALEKGAIAKLGNPVYDDTTYSKTPWNDRRIIKYGGNNEKDGNGAKVIIPQGKGFNTVWVRVLGERWTVIHAYFLDGAQEDLGLWPGGWRSANSYCPDGSLSDGYRTQHQWLPIPVGRAGEVALIAKPHTGSDFWLSGLAFSRNPWAHAAQSAVGYYWALNGGKGTYWTKDWHNWNGDSLSRIDPKTNLELKVPVVPSGRDKLLYLIEHNNNWNGCMHTGITVNDQKIERFMATYDSPFARHWNSKRFERYIAARIPANLIAKDDRWLSVRIDMSKQDNGIHFREIGTHDLDMPLDY